MLTARMFSTLYLAFVFAAGVVGTARLLKRYPLGAMEILIIGGGVGFVAVHGLIFGAILFLPFKAASKGVLVLCGGYVLYTLSRLLKDGDLYRWGLSVQKQFSRESNIMHAKTLAVFLALVGLVSWYANVYLNTLVYAKGTYAAAFAGIGDVPYHLTQIARLATGDHVVLDDPIYAGIPLTYPFFINFMSAVLRRLGAPL